MPAFDPAAVNYLDHGEALKPVFYAWLDILGDPIRATTAGFSVQLTATGDTELDGVYQGIDPEVVNISEVMHQEGGSQTVTASLSGLLLPDNELLNTIGDRTNWQGRVARLWVQIRDENGNTRGAIAPYYTGYMNAIEIHPSPDGQTIEVQIENYLVSLNEATGRTWMSQSIYDAGDTSASATLASANNAGTGQGGRSDSGWNR